MPETAETIETRRKRVRFRAWHRGIREMDLVMGRFADREIDVLTEAELDEFERLMNEPDQLAFGWVLGRVPVPAEFDTPLFARIRAYKAA